MSVDDLIKDHKARARDSYLRAALTQNDSHRQDGANHLHVAKELEKRKQQEKREIKGFLVKCVSVGAFIWGAATILGREK